MPPVTAATPQLRHLPALVVFGAWAAIVPYVVTFVGLELDVSALVEVVDHVVPGVLAVALALLAARSAGTRRDVALAGCVLCGLWVTASHVPLLLDAGDEARPWSTVLLMMSAGPPLLGAAIAALLASTR